jgi:uncharacterized membrane protein
MEGDRKGHKDEITRIVDGNGRPSGERTMTTTADLWAIGYDDMERADEIREEIVRLGWDKHYLILLDVAVVVRRGDGSFTFDRKPFPAFANFWGGTVLGFLAGLVVATPLPGAAVGALVGGVGTAAALTSAGISDQFVREVEGMMKPGTSALFVLADKGDMEVILHNIRGLGGTVLKTNVDLEQAKLVQSTLAAAAADAVESGDKQDKRR